MVLMGVLLLITLFGSGCARVANPEGWAAPVSDGTRLYAQLDSGVLWAFTLNGTSIETSWRYPAEGDNASFDAIYATPIAANSVIYLVSHEGNVVALNTADGRPLSSWGIAPVELGARVISTPAFDGSRLFVATEQGDLFTVDAVSGAATRLHSGEGRIWSAVALAGGVIYLGNMDARLVTAVDATTGAVLWQQSAAGASVADLRIEGQLLLVGSLDRALHALDLGADGAQQWQFDGDGWFMAASVPADSVVYAATLGGSVYAVDPATGNARWTFHQDGVAFRAAPILMGDTVIAIARKGEIFGLNRSDGTVRWQQQIDSVTIDANPMPFGADVIVVTTKGDLVRIDPDSQTAQRISSAN